MGYRPLLSYLTVLSLTALLLSSCGGGTKEENGSDSSSKQPVKKSIYIANSDLSGVLISTDSEGDVYIVWEEGGNIYLAKSKDQGYSFSIEKVTDADFSGSLDSSCALAAPNGSASDPVLASMNRDFYLAWVDRWEAGGSNSALKLYSSVAGSCMYVSNRYNVSSPYIALTSPGNLHVVWEEADSSGGQRDIFYRRSRDGGQTFMPSIDPPEDPIQISSTAMESSEPLLGFDGSMNVDVIWVEGSGGSKTVVFNRSEDGGNNFSSYSPIQVSGNESGDPVQDASCPVIGTHGKGKVYVAYRGATISNTSIYFSRWIDRSRSFTDPINISRFSDTPSCPGMAISPSGIIYVLWEDSGDIWLAISMDGGHYFSLKNISQSLGGLSTSPVIALDGEYINIVWVNETTDNDRNTVRRIYFSGSRDHGKTFSDPGAISDPVLTNSHSPVVTTDGKGSLYIVWIDETTAGSAEIYFTRNYGARDLPVSAERSLAQFLDISGDGLSDIVIGAEGAGGTGEVYIFFSDSLKDDLDGSDLVDKSTSMADLSLTGESPGDLFGYSAAIGGDINGDGYGDVVVGAKDASGGNINSGKVYIYYGGPPSVMDGNAVVTITNPESTTGDQLGFSVSPAGDVNGDGFDDIIIGAPKGSQGIPFTGVAYIFYGGPSLGSKDGYPDISVSAADVILNGENTGDNFGYAVARAGDFNNDGYDDVVVGAPMAGREGTLLRTGMAYIFYGGTIMDSVPDVKIIGEAEDDNLGFSVSGGDINGDGYGDVIIGAPYADSWCSGSANCTYTGRTYVIYGSSTGNRSVEEIDLGEIATSGGPGGAHAVTILNGHVDYGLFGYSTGYGGDLNNDGYGDVIVGGKYSGMDSDYKGRVYVYTGSAWIHTTSEISTADITLIGEHQEDRFGTVVAGVGDVNGDGMYDVAVGAFLYDSTSGSTTVGDTGRMYLYLGRFDWTPGTSIDPSSADATFTGDSSGNHTGSSLYRGAGN